MSRLTFLRAGWMDTYRLYIDNRACKVDVFSVEVGGYRAYTPRDAGRLRNRWRCALSLLHMMRDQVPLPAWVNGVPVGRIVATDSALMHSEGMDWAYYWHVAGLDKGGHRWIGDKADHGDRVFALCRLQDMIDAGVGTF